MPNHASILGRKNDGYKLSATPGRLESCLFLSNLNQIEKEKA